MIRPLSNVVPVAAFLATTAFAGEPAVPLFTPPLTAPEEVAGTGVAPEVGIRATIDAQGRVTHTELVSIEPSTEYDELFERVVVDTVSRWRYYPAREDGEPVETRIEWHVKFPAVPEADDERAGAANWRRLGRDQDRAADLRRRILAMPPAMRADNLRRIAEIARTCMHGKEVRRFTTPRFMVYTDAPDPSVAQTLANNLEATFNVVGDLIGDGVQPQPEPYRIVVFLYASQRDFDELKRSVQTFEWAAGFYTPFGMLAFHMEMPSNESLLSIMLHEAVHAYIDRYLSRPGTFFPRWLDEGFAEYVGNSTIRKGQLIPGKTRNSEVFRTPWGMFMDVSSERLSIDDVKTAVRRGEAMSVAELVSSKRTDFYGQKRRLYYPMSWILIHFLRHGKDEWEDGRFADLVLYVSEGFSPADAFRQVYGEPAELEEDYRNYVKKF